MARFSRKRSAAPRKPSKRPSKKLTKKPSKELRPKPTASNHQAAAPIEAPAKRRLPRPEWPVFEAEVLQGLEGVAYTELSALRDLDWLPETLDAARAAEQGKHEKSGGGWERGAPLRFRYGGDPTRLEKMRSVVAIYALHHLDVPRPRGLLGHEQFTALVGLLRPVLQAGGHASLRISAAGKESEVMQRLAGDLAEALSVPHDAVEGELLLRLRPSEVQAGGWEVLARLTPRPLSAREWRVCNREGGLNASVAYAALVLAGLRSSDRVFNPMCGSGTLLIERALMGPYDAMVGVDIDLGAIACTRANLSAAGRRIEAAQVDALDTGLPPRSFDLIVCDLPWGDDIGSHTANAELYPRFLGEMYRLCSKSGRMMVITHELRLFEAAAAASAWHWREVAQVFSGGHWPKLYLLTK